MSKLAGVLSNLTDEDALHIPEPKFEIAIKKQQSSINSEYCCPVCGDKGTNQFVQAECLHIFCIICYKKSQRRRNNKCCPMCKKEFELMSTAK